MSRSGFREERVGSEPLVGVAPRGKGVARDHPPAGSRQAMGLGPAAYRITAVIPHVEAAEALTACIELLRLQTERPYLLVIDTGSSAATIDQLEQLRGEDLEIHYLRAHGYPREASRHALACDLALALSRTEHLYLTHPHCFLRRREYLASLLARCDATHPVVGYERRHSPAAMPLQRGEVSLSATLLHVPTLRQLGVCCSFERAQLRFGLPTPAAGWPDATACLNRVLAAVGVQPILVGAEASPRHADENLDQRSRPESQVSREVTNVRRACLDGPLLEARARAHYWRNPSRFLVEHRRALQHAVDAYWAGTTRPEPSLPTPMASPFRALLRARRPWVEQFTVGVAIAPEAPLAGAALVRQLRERGVEVTYPAAAEEELLAALLGESPGASPRRDMGSVPAAAWLDGAWVANCDLLLVPHVSASLAPTVERALADALPVLLRGSDEAERDRAPGALLVPPDAEGASLSGFVGALCRSVACDEQALGEDSPAEPAKALLQNPTRGHSSPAEARVLASGPWAQDPGVSVVIPTLGGERLARCLRLLRRAAGRVPLQVILVVTGGLSGSLPPCDEVVRCEPPFVWARANNAGLQVARAPFVLVLNDDCYFRRDGDLARLVERLKTCGHLCAVAPRGTGFPAHWDQSALGRGLGLRETRFSLCGACFLVRREAFCAVGAFDERFVTYGCDEVDWFYRARAQGYQWAVDTEVSVEHEWSASFRSRRIEELPQSMRLFAELHGVEAVDGAHWDPVRCAVSWIIASRNNAGHLARSLGSLADHRPLYPAATEVVLALDGSTDPSATVAEQFNASLDEPLLLRVVKFREPAGSAAAAKNRALRLARGEVHLPMDDDDATLPGRAALVDALTDGVDVAVGSFWLVGRDGSVSERRPAEPRFESVLQAGAQNWGLWATAIRRETWRQFGMHTEDRRCVEDLDLWLRWLRDGVRFQRVDQSVHLYLTRAGSVVDCHAAAAIEEEIRAAYRAGQGSPRLGLCACS